MRPTTLLLARHAATAANLCRPYTLQGLRPDSDLAPAGIAQARAPAGALATLPITAIYCSPLRRAAHTAGVIADALSLSPQVEADLVEADVGEWTGLTWAEIERRWPDAHRAFHEDPERHGYLGGEDFAAVRRRGLSAVERLTALHPGGTLLIVGHGVMNRVLLAHWLGLPSRFARRLPQDNAGYNVVEFGGDGVRVRTINEAAHLAEPAAA